jgi:hypothetical protein
MKKRIERVKNRNQDLCELLQGYDVVGLKILCREYRCCYRGGKNKHKFVKQIVELVEQFSSMPRQISESRFSEFNYVEGATTEERRQGATRIEETTRSDQGATRIEETTRSDQGATRIEETTSEATTNLEDELWSIVFDEIELQNSSVMIISTRSGRMIQPTTRYSPSPQIMVRPRQRVTTFKQIKVYNVKPNKKNSIKEECPICLASHTCIETQCRHRFCSCIMNVISKQALEKKNAACPCCRTPIETVKFSEEAQYKLLKNISGTLPWIICKN